LPFQAPGTGGARFGRFPGGGETGSLEEKIANVGLMRKLNPATNSEAKLHLSMVDVFAYVDHLSWESYNESTLLIDSVEHTKTTTDTSLKRC